MVRMAMSIHGAYERVVPDAVRAWVSGRFEQLSEKEREGGSYDLIRATVNLTTSAILISVATR